MPKNQKLAKRNQSSSDSDEFANGVSNPVHSKLERLHREMSRGTSDLGGLIRDEFTKSTLLELTKIVSVKTDDQNFSLNQRLEILRGLQQLVASEEKRITPQVPDVAPLLWKERGKENYKMSPCDFVIQQYPSYGYGLHLAHIRQLDFPLYSALTNLKKSQGWPDNFYLPTKKEFLDQKIEKMSDDEIEEARRFSSLLKARDLS